MRREDVAHLLRHFLARFCAEENRNITAVSGEALAPLTASRGPATSASSRMRFIARSSSARAARSACRTSRSSADRIGRPAGDGEPRRRTTAPAHDRQRHPDRPARPAAAFALLTARRGAADRGHRNRGHPLRDRPLPGPDVRGGAPAQDRPLDALSQADESWQRFGRRRPKRSNDRGDYRPRRRTRGVPSTLILHKPDTMASQ